MDKEVIEQIENAKMDSYMKGRWDECTAWKNMIKKNIEWYEDALQYDCNGKEDEYKAIVEALKNLSLKSNEPWIS